MRFENGHVFTAFYITPKLIFGKSQAFGVLIQADHITKNITITTFTTSAPGTDLRTELAPVPQPSHFRLCRAC